MNVRAECRVCHWAGAWVRVEDEPNAIWYATHFAMNAYAPHGLTHTPEPLFATDEVPA